MSYFSHFAPYSASRWSDSSECGRAEKSRAFSVKTLREYCKSSLTVLLFPGTSAPGPGRDLSVWTLPLHLLPSLQPEAPHALPPALPPFRSQGERGADHWHGGRRLPDGRQWLGGPEGGRNVPAAAGRSAAEVVSGWGLLQSHPHQRGAAGKRSLHALTLQHVQGPSWQHCKFLGSTRCGARSQIQSQWSQWSQRLPLQPWHQYQDRHRPAYETLRYVKLLFSIEFTCIFAIWFILKVTNWVQTFWNVSFVFLLSSSLFLNNSAWYHRRNQISKP